MQIVTLEVEFLIHCAQESAKMRFKRLVVLGVMISLLASPSQEQIVSRFGDGGEGLEVDNHLQMEEPALRKHHKHHKHPPPPSPPPPSPSPPPPSPPPPSSPPPPPPPPPPPATVMAIEISNGALLVPRFDPAVHRYNTTVGEGVTEIRVTVSVPDTFQVYKVKLNSSRLVSGKESSPIPMGANGETVDLVITVSARNHSNNRYYLSVHRIEKPSMLRRILKQSLVVVLVILLIACILYISFSILRASPWSTYWFPFERHYQPVRSD